MFKAFENLYAGLIARLADLKNDERGQTSGEYIAVTAVAILIAITVIYTVFAGQLTSAITVVGSGLQSWVGSVF